MNEPSISPPVSVRPGAAIECTPSMKPRMRSLPVGCVSFARTAALLGLAPALALCARAVVGTVTVVSVARTVAATRNVV